MGLMKRELHNFEELYCIENGMKTPYLATAHIHGLCIRCGQVFNCIQNGLCVECTSWAISP